MKTEQTLSLAKLTPDATISQIISADREAGNLLASIGLSPEAHEQETLRSICQQKQWSEVEVLEWVKKNSVSDAPEVFSEDRREEEDLGADLGKWFGFMERSFIQPNLKILGELKGDFPRVLKVHGNQYPWLKHVKWHFSNFDESLGLYYAFERKKFYPLAERLQNGKKRQLNHGIIQKLRKSVEIIGRDQQRLNYFMDTIREKTGGFEVPDNACATLRIQYENFESLFARIVKQFNYEAEKIIPLVEREINQNG